MGLSLPCARLLLLSFSISGLPLAFVLVVKQNWSLFTLHQYLGVDLRKKHHFSG
jgi:hypothetical protein